MLARAPVYWNAMSISSDLDPVAVRRQFDRRTARIARADFLLREVERRMLDRLEVVRMQPEVVLDVGAGLGHGALALQQRYPSARVLGADLSPRLAAEAARLHGPVARGGLAGRLERWFGAGTRAAGALPSFFAADAASLPLAPSSVHLLWSNLAWHWFTDPKAVLDQWYRVIRPEGLLMFSAFGVDTLRELRGLGARLPVFPDMHDIGDALTEAGFADPVMDAERLSITWKDAGALLEEVRALGGDALRGRRGGLRGRTARARWEGAVESLRGADGLITLSFELVYGHAWCPPHKRRADGYAPVNFVARRRPPSA